MSTLQTSNGEPGTTPGLRRYLLAHHMAACLGVDAFTRASRSQGDWEFREELRALSLEVEEDRASLETILEGAGLGWSGTRRRLVGGAARVRALVPRVPPRQPQELVDLLELEALTVAVHGKLLGWLALRYCVDAACLESVHLDRLIRRAEDQASRLDRMRRVAADRSLGPTT